MIKSEKKDESEKIALEEQEIIEKKEATTKKESLEEESLEDKLKIAQEKLLRSMAETENQRRRFEKEKKEAFEFGAFNFAGEALSLIDNIDRAIISFKNDESLKDNKDLEKIIDGIEIVKKDLISTFKKNGIEAIDCLNKKFDPNFHQAMLEIESSDKEPGLVVQEIQKGYMMKDRLLRPSLVGVSKKINEKNEKK